MGQKEKKNITRRDFVKKISKGAAAVGLTSMVPRFVGSAIAAKRDYILIGRPNPSTGPIAGFGEPSPWIDMKAIDAINKEGGIYIKEYGKKVPVKMKLVDTESNPTKAGEVASRLILHDKVDLMLALHTPLTVNPVSALCERYKVPCISLINPADAWLKGGPYKWSFLVFWYVDADSGNDIGFWDTLAQQTNKVVGGLWPNDEDGAVWADSFKKQLPPKGYKIVDPGRFPFGIQDWTSTINLFKQEKVEILHAMLIPPDWITCWRQMHQQGFIPKIVTIGKAILFPADVYALGGDLPKGLTTGMWWTPYHPFKSSLTGETAKDLCDAWSKETKKQWNASIGYGYAGFEIAVNVLKRAQSVDKDKIREAISETKMDTIVGPIKFNEQHVSETRLVMGQWVKGKKWPWEVEIIWNGHHPEVPKTAEVIFPLPKYK